MSAPGVASPTDSAGLASSSAVGVYVGTAGKVTFAGAIAAALFTTQGGAPAAGGRVYLAAAADDAGTGAGKFTATPPTTGYEADVGVCIDPSNYAGARTARILFFPAPPLKL